MTNEPKVDEAVNITEYHDSDEVTTKSDVDAGLDNGVIEGGEERESLPVCEASTKALPCPDLLRPDCGTEESGEAAAAGGRILSRSESEISSGPL